MYLVDMPTFGWQAFGGTVTSTSPNITVTVTDAVRRKIFIAPLGQQLSLDAGAFESLVFNPATRTVVVIITAAPIGVANAAPAPHLEKLKLQNRAKVYEFAQVCLLRGLDELGRPPLICASLARHWCKNPAKKRQIVPADDLHRVICSWHFVFF
jgi:hypothetical protein